MNAKKILIMTWLLGTLLSLFCYFNSPETVAMHFNGEGIPDSWVSKNINLILWISIYFLLAGLFLSIPSILKKTPIKFVNIPNKQYWLAPERMTHTISVISNLLYWFGIALNIFLIVLEFIVFRASLLDKVKLNNIDIFILLGVFCLYIILWLGKFYSQFKKPV